MPEAVDNDRRVPESVTFGEFSFHFPSGFLYTGGRTVVVQHRASKVLRYLLERPREVVSREELIDNVWQSAHVSDASVTEAIKQLRKTLGDDAAEPTYIQTIQRRGYRFIAPIREDLPSTESNVAAQPHAGARTGVLWDARIWMATTLLLAIALIVLLLIGWT